MRLYSESEIGAILKRTAELTNIRYSLPERATVELSVYDATGRLVDVLVKKEQAAGWHEAGFEAADFT